MTPKLPPPVSLWCGRDDHRTCGAEWCRCACHGRPTLARELAAFRASWSELGSKIAGVLRGRK